MRVLRDKFEWNGNMIHDARGKLLGISNRVSPAETFRVNQRRSGRRSHPRMRYGGEVGFSS
jgi:hypothetical protein